MANNFLDKTGLQYFWSLIKAKLNLKQDSLSTAQLNACNSGITSTKVSTYDSYTNSNYVNNVELNSTLGIDIVILSANTTGLSAINTFVASINTEGFGKKYLTSNNEISDSSGASSISIEMTRGESVTNYYLKAEVYDASNNMYSASTISLTTGTNIATKLYSDDGTKYVDMVYSLTDTGTLTFSKYDSYSVSSATTVLKITKSKIDGSSSSSTDLNLADVHVTVDKTLKAEQDAAGNNIASTYYTKRGGRLNGSINVVSNGGINALTGTVDTGYIQVCGGTKYANGATLQLKGNNAANYAGCFTLRAYSDSTNNKALMGKPDGTLTWDSTNISLEGHTHSYLPLAGGTISGTIKTSTQTFVQRTNDTGYLEIRGATNYNKGAFLYLCGKDTTASNKTAGSFVIAACNGTTTVNLKGTSDKTLTWDNKTVLTEASTGSSTPTNGSFNYTTLNNGLKMCYGKYTFPQPSTAVAANGTQTATITLPISYTSTASMVPVATSAVSTWTARIVAASVNTVTVDIRNISGTASRAAITVNIQIIGS